MLKSPKYTRVPKYVITLMKRSKFNLVEGDLGYTLDIYKKHCYQQVMYFEEEIERLVEWVKRVHYVADDIPVVKVLSIPEKTHYVDQKAVVTIYDPVMKELEKYIPEANSGRM